MARRHRALPTLLVLAGAIELACAADDVIVLRLPPATAGMAGAGMAGAAGLGGSEATSGGAGMTSGGVAGTETAGSAGSAGSNPDGSAGTPEQGGGTGGSSGAGASGLGGTGGTAGAGDVDDCAKNDDCPPSRVCAKETCASERGICEPEPLFCEATPAPVCGCDNVTYWNDCVRRSAGVAASTRGECRAGAAECDTARDCGVDGAVCARLLPTGPIDMCPPGPGTCWVLPEEQCDPGDSRRWVECVPPGAPLPPFPPPCVDTCRALQSGRPHIAARRDIPCP